MINFDKWKESIDEEVDEKELRNCRRVIELFGKADVNELTTEFVKLEIEVGECLKSMAADIQEEDAIDESVIEAEMHQGKNEMMYDMANAFLNVANGVADTDAVKYSVLYDKDECEHMLAVITLIYERINNIIQS